MKLIKHKPSTNFSIVILALVLLTFLYHSPVIAGKRLSNKELLDFYTNKTIMTIHYKFGPLNAYLGTDGIAELGKFHLKAKWWVDQKLNNLCIEVNLNKKIFCHYTELNDDGTHTIVHDDLTRLVEIKSYLEGNKLDLNLTAK